MAKLVQSTCKECNKVIGCELCIECGKILCTKCKAAHLKKKASKKHHFDKTLHKLPLCVIHSKEVVFYCSSCALLICPNCMLEKHKLHDVEDIDVAISAKKASIDNEIKDLEDRSENVSQIIEDLDGFEDGYKIDNAIVVNLISARGEQLKTLIDKHTANMLKQVQDEEHVHLDRKSEETTKLEDIRLLYESQTLRLKSSMRDIKDEDLLLSYVEWEEDIKHLKERELSVFKPFPPIRFITPIDENEKLKAMFGRLDIGFREVRQGDRIKIKSSITEPVNGWGEVTHESIGIVTGVCDDVVKVDFSEFKGWEGVLSEIEVVQTTDVEPNDK